MFSFIIVEKPYKKQGVVLWRSVRRALATGADQNNCSKNRTQILNHKNKISLRRKGFPSFVTSSSILSAPIVRDTRRQIRNGSNWHHDGVCQEIKEIQKLHTRILPWLKVLSLRKRDFPSAMIITPIRSVDLFLFQPSSSPRR